MIDKEIREIRRRFYPDKNNITRVVGCFVNTNKEIIYRISQPLVTGDSVISEKLLSTFRKALSGSLGASLNNVEFSTKEVSDGEKHGLLMRLRESALSDTEALESLYALISDSLKFETNYVILLTNDIYDVTSYHSDGESAESSTVFSYVSCVVCPIKTPTESISFREADSSFHLSGAAGILSSPELGFTFPAFDDRQTNIYGALYYARSKSERYGDFTRAVFGKEPPQSPVYQKAAFSRSLSEALSEECDLPLVNVVHAAIGEMVEAHKESRDPEPLLLTKHTVASILENAGVSQERIEKLGEAMDESLGKGKELTPKNIVDYKKFELEMPEVKIKVSAEYRDLVSVRDIAGEKYVVIKMSGPIEINGIQISSGEEEKEEN